MKNIGTSNRIWSFALFCFLLFADMLQAQHLKTFPTIPGRTPSNKYQCRVRQVGSNVWQDAFVLQTISLPRINNPDGSNQNGYVPLLTNWTASWIAFEFYGAAVEVEISKVGGDAITKAMVRPVGHASAANIIDGKVYITFQNSANINVDVDGQMEDRYTGMGYNGPPVHTISLFANPIFNEPSPTNPRVYALNPGETIPNSSTWDTLVFKPGIHRVGMPYVMSSNKVMYVPGNAVVHGTIQPPNTWGSSAIANWSIYGSGALSGEEVPRAPGEKFNKPFTYQSSSVKLEGFVIVDPAHHTFNMNNTLEDPTKVNIYKNLKILGWRVNGDGLNAFRNSTITDCFFRCQDDHFYYGGDNVKISNCVSWADFNGSVLYVTKGASSMESSYFKDIKVIYHRAYWHYWEGGRVISFRDREPGNVIKNVQIKNILVEDPFPAFPPFYFKMRNPNNSNALFDYDNILIENVRQDHPGVAGSGDNNFGKPRNTMLGLDDARKFSNITFKNCSYKNINLCSFTDGEFLTNSFIQNVNFISDCNVTLPLTFLNFSGYLKENNAYLNWETINEKNTSHFDVERTLDLVSFTKVGQVQCSVNEAASNKYTFKDYNLGKGSQYYRIKQIDKDGKFSYSTIVVIDANENGNKSELIFPNPANQDINFNCPNGFQIFNLSGQMMLESKQATFSINISTLTSGMYFLKTQNQTIKFIKF